MRHSKKEILLCLALAYVGWYFYYLNQYAVNIPYVDDYDAILGYILQFRNADFWVKVQSLLLPHNEHIMIMTRIASWLNISFGNTVNFYWLILIGNCLLLLQLWLLYQLFCISERTSPIYFFLVILVFLNPQYSPTSFWAMALWSNIWVLIPVTLSIFLLSNQKSWYWALPTAVLALFSNGNGLMIWPVGIFILLLAQRPLFQYIIWGITGLVFGGLYFYLIRQQPSGGVSELINLPLLPLNTLAFAGAYFALAGGKVGQFAAVLAGAGVLIMGFFTFKVYLKTKQKTDLILLSLLVFIFLTALAVALFRAEKGMDIIIGGRYRQYSSLAVAVSFLMGFRLIDLKAKLGMRSLPWVVIVTITFLSFLRDLGVRRATEGRTVADYHNILHNGIDVYTTDGTPRFVKIAKGVRAFHLYLVPSKYDIMTQLRLATRLPIQGVEQRRHIEGNKADGVTCGNHWLLEDSRLSLPTTDETLYLILTNGQKNIIFPTASKRNDIVTMLKQQQYFKRGVEAEAYDCAQSLNSFQIRWLKVGNKPKLYVTNSSIFAR